MGQTRLTEFGLLPWAGSLGPKVRGTFLPQAHSEGECRLDYFLYPVSRLSPYGTSWNFGDEVDDYSALLIKGALNHWKYSFIDLLVLKQQVMPEFCGSVSANLV